MKLRKLEKICGSRLIYVSSWPTRGIEFNPKLLEGQNLTQPIFLNITEPLIPLNICFLLWSWMYLQKGITFGQFILIYDLAWFFKNRIPHYSTSTWFNEKWEQGLQTNTLVSPNQAASFHTKKNHILNNKAKYCIEQKKIHKNAHYSKVTQLPKGKRSITAFINMGIQNAQKRHVPRATVRYGLTLGLCASSKSWLDFNICHSITWNG